MRKALASRMHKIDTRILTGCAGMHNFVQFFGLRTRKFYPANFISYHYNSETGSYKFKENSELFQLAKTEGKEIKLEYKENDFSKDLKDANYPVNITKEEFDAILKIGNFNNTGNKPAQNLCYCLIDATE